MRSVFVAVVVFACAGCVSGTTTDSPTPEPQIPKPAPQEGPATFADTGLGHAKLISSWARRMWANNPPVPAHLVDKDHVLEVVRLVEESATAHGISWTVRVQLANLVVESKLDPDPPGDGSCVGIGQINPRYRQEWLKIAVAAGFEIPHSRAFLEDEIRLAGAAFAAHFDAANGDVWDAVRRYNGSGPRALRHKFQVYQTHRGIYGTR